MIDMHAHWRPAELIDALRARTKEPRIVRNQDEPSVRQWNRPVSGHHNVTEKLVTTSWNKSSLSLLKISEYVTLIAKRKCHPRGGGYIIAKAVLG
jgi:hypothetical protein